MESQVEKRDTITIFSDNLKRMMQLKSKTRREVCDELNIKYTTYCDWVNGKTYPRVEAIEGLAGYFGISVGDFFIDYDNADSHSKKRFEAYARKIGVWDMDTVNKLSNDQIADLVKAGICIRHKTLEEYMDERGEDAIIPSGEITWGNMVGDEVW